MLWILFHVFITSCVLFECYSSPFKHVFIESLFIQVCLIDIIIYFGRETCSYILSAWWACPVVVMSLSCRLDSCFTSPLAHYSSSSPTLRRSPVRKDSRAFRQGVCVAQMQKVTPPLQLLLTNVWNVFKFIVVWDHVPKCIYFSVHFSKVFILYFFLTIPYSWILLYLLQDSRCVYVHAILIWKMFCLKHRIFICSYPTQNTIKFILSRNMLDEILSCLSREPESHEFEHPHSS